MAAATTAIATAVDAIVQSAIAVQQLGASWYRANREWDDFPRKVNNLRDKHHVWACELQRFGMLSQDLLGLDEKLRKLQMLLEKEESRLKSEEEKRSRRRRPSNYATCLKKLSLTVFPGELTARIESVIKVFDEIPGILEERRRVIDVLAATSSALPSRLPFGPDKRYVPLKHSEARVRNALELQQDEAGATVGPRVVVLHGPPGSGKTALTKSTALHYYDEKLGQLSYNLAVELLPPQKHYFLDGVFYLACGPGADAVTKYFELLQMMGLPGVTLPGEIAKTYTEVALHKQLMGFLKDKSMLIILDDVWEADLLESMVVPSSGKVKYLVTSQNANLWRNALKVPIEKVCLEDARKILASHVELENAAIPQHLQEVADKFIAETEANPLALANLATTIGSKRATDLDEWNASAQDLFTLLDSEDKDAVPIFNMRYPRSFPSSMTLAVASLATETQKLLILATMFEGPAVPEVVVLIVYQSMSGGPGRFRKRRNDLEDRALIEVQSAYPWGIGFQQLTWSIHGLRKRFIQARYQDVVSSFTSFLIVDQKTKVLDINIVDNDILVSALCALYGEKEWAEKGAKKLGISLKHFSGLRRTAIEPIVLLLNRGHGKQPFEGSFLLARQVFLRYVCHNEVDEDSICHLLESPETALPTCGTIRRLASITTDGSILTYESQGIMKGLVTLLAHGVQQQVQDGALRALVNLSSKGCDMQRIAAFPGLLEGLTGLLGKDIPWKCQMWAAWTLANLVVDGENKTKIASPGVLEGLGRLLNSNVNTDVQEQATRALAGLAYSNENKHKISEIPEILAGLMCLLSKEENSRVQEHSAMALGNLAGAQIYKQEILGNMRKVYKQFTSLLQQLVNMLAMNGNSSVQEQAAMALANFAGASPNMVLEIEDVPHAIERLVGLLSRKHSLGVQERAAMAIANLSVYWSKLWSVPLSDQYNNRKIFYLIKKIPEALERFVEMLSEDENPVVQRHAVMALANLAKAPYNKQKIAEFPHALERLVKLLSNRGTPVVQEHAARALGNLAAAEEENPTACAVAADIRSRILKVKGAVEKLLKLQLLSDEEYANEEYRLVQMEAEDALSIIEPSKVDKDYFSRRSNEVNIVSIMGCKMPQPAREDSWSSPPSRYTLNRIKNRYTLNRSKNRK